MIELLTPDEDSARRVQPELSRIQRQRLESIIEQCCSELSAPDRIHRIDLLEVNLGTVDIRNLEWEVPNKLKSMLHKALAKQIEKQDSEARRHDHDASVSSYLELVAFFAATGNLPWWADYSDSRLIPQALEALLEHAPERLGDLLRTIAQERDQLLRVVLHCEDETLSGLLRSLVSDSPSFAEMLPQQAEEILRALHQLPGTVVPQVRVLFWLSVIRHSAVADWATTNFPVRFWQQALGEIETRSHEAFVSIATSLLRIVRTPGDIKSSHLTPLLVAIVANRQGRVFISLPAELQKELVQLLDQPASLSTRVKSEIMQDVRSTPSETDNLEETLPREISPERLQSETARRAYRPIRHPKPLDLAFGDADAVYVENSGLVLLWPFLPRFFERLELVEGDKFASAAAQHRAAGLLQHLVTEDSSPPEYQTVLNKILCGLDPSEVLGFGPPVTDSESEECANLLTAVIAQAPILRDMSIDGFRGSFLLRKGMLSARDGVWLLRVERETYDVVLDRMPWSVNWVRLPWMEVPLGVEW